MFALRPATLRFATGQNAARTSLLSSVRSIHIGSSVPAVPLQSGTPANKIDLSKEFAKLGKPGVIIGVPGAFTPGCSQKHVPGYLNHGDVVNGKVGKVVVVSVNDAFVMNAWADSFGAKPSNVEFLADPKGEFTQALDKELLWDGLKEATGGLRSKRYAAVIADGKVVKAAVEPDGTGVNVSTAEIVLG